MDALDNLGADDSTQPILRLWAADRYAAIPDASAVKNVRFDFEKGYGGGCETCGYGADEDSLTCRVELHGGQVITSDESYTSSLLNDILRFAGQVAGK